MIGHHVYIVFQGYVSGMHWRMLVLEVAFVLILNKNITNWREKRGGMIYYKKWTPQLWKLSSPMIDRVQPVDSGKQM